MPTGTDYPHSLFRYPRTGGCEPLTYSSLDHRFRRIESRSIGIIVPRDVRGLWLVGVGLLVSFTP